MKLVIPWAQACASLDVDLVTLDLTDPRLFRLRPGPIQTALKRGIMFEICYSGALRTDAGRRVFFQNAAGMFCFQPPRELALQGVNAPLPSPPPAPFHGNRGVESFFLVCSVLNPQEK